MKHLKTFENRTDNLDNLEDNLIKILKSKLCLSYIDDKSISDDSMYDAVDEIIEYLKKLGIDLNLHSDIKKYNL